MPIRLPTKEEADLIALAGVDPANYVIDQDTGEAAPKKEFDTWGGALAEGGKAVLRAGRDVVADAVEFPGTVADAIRSVVGTKGSTQLIPGETRSVFKPVAEGIRSIGEETLAPGLLAGESTKQRIAQKIGGAIGTIGLAAGPGLATRGMSAAAEFVPAAALMLSGAQDVNRRAKAQGASEAEAAGRALSYLPIAWAENLAMGRFGPSAAGWMAKRLGSGGTIMREAGQGAVGAGADELTQQALADEKLNLEQAAEAAALGGVAQGAVAGAGRLTTMRPQVEKKSTEDLAATMAGDPEVKPQEPTTIVADEALESRIAARLDAQGRGETYQTIKPSPVDLVFQEAQRRKIPMDDNMLRTLEEIYAGNDANETKVFEAARVLLDKGRVQRPAKLEPTPEMVEKQNAELEKIDARLDQVTKRKDVILEAQKKRAEEALKQPPANAGDVWLKLAEERAATEQGELTLLEQQATQLIEQRKLLTSSGNVTPQGGPQQIAEGQFQRRYFPGAIISKTPWDVHTVGYGDVGAQTGELAGQPMSPRFDLPERMPAEAPAKVPPQEPFSTQPPASEFAAAEALRQAEARQPKQIAPEPVPVGGREAVRPRERGPRGQQERELIQAELDALEAERTGVPVKKIVEQRRAKEIEAYMRGETLPGMEGEQSLPFSGEKPTETYGTLVPPSLIKAIEDVGIRVADPIRLLNRATEHQLSRIARKSPLGAYIADKVNTTLFRERNVLKNRKVKEFEALQAKYKGLLEDPRYLAWANEAHSAKQVDYTKLPAELRAGAKAIDDFKKSFHAEQRARNVHVKEITPDGKRIYRPPQDVEGYGMYSVDPAVYKAAEKGGAEWDAYEKAWVDNWQKHGGTADEAQRTLSEFIGYATQARHFGGEPLFSAVRNQIGKPLPESWRSKNLADSINHYIDSWAKDIAYAEVVQKDPLMRRAFGIRQDPTGADTTVADANYKPTKAEWALMIDRGRRNDAPWVKDLKLGMPLGQPLLGDVSFGENLFASYSERPLTSTRAGKIVEAGNQIAATAMLQHVSKLRNVAQSAITTLDYVPWRDAPAVFQSLVKSLADPVAAIGRAREAGSQQADVLQHEFAEALSEGMYKTLRGFRKWSGLNGLDAYAKALAYNMAEAGVKAQVARLGADASLLKEFSSFDKLSKGATLDSLVQEAATNIANRVDPAFDVRSLSGNMIPQNRGFLANMYRLMTWSVGRFNHWYTDAYLPAVTGGDNTRLLKSILTGSLGAVATQEFLAWLQDKMPRDLSFGEWLKLDTEQQKKEFAPMLFGYLQAQGSMGVLGDILYAGVRTWKGRPITQDYTQPMLPGFLVIQQLGGTLVDFMYYAAAEKGIKNIDVTDIMKLGVETAKINQSVRVVLGRGDDWLHERLKTEADEAKVTREKRVFEETTGRSALTGDLKAPRFVWGQAAAMKPNPFSLHKEFNLREGEDFRKLGPALDKAAREGASFKTEAGLMSPEFYRNVDARRGRTVTEELIASGRKKENERRIKRPLAQQLNRISARIREED